MKNKLKYNLIYIFLFLVVSATGLSKSLGLQEGIFKAPIYYTTLSGLICFIYFLIAGVRGVYYLMQDRNINSIFLLPRFKGAITICITVTLLVYHFMVYEGPILSLDLDIYNLIPHYIVPILVIAHYFVFDEKGIYKRIDPILWLIIPLIYFSWANIVAMRSLTPFWEGKWYPYSFMDLTLHSLNAVMLTVLVLLIFFIALGYGLYWIDHSLKEEELIYRGDGIKTY